MKSDNMRDHFPKFKRWLKNNGYTYKDKPIFNNHWCFLYVKKLGRYYAATASTCTGLLIIEILKSKSIVQLNFSDIP